MKNIFRIIAVVALLGGTVFFFRAWALNEVDTTFATLDESFVAASQTASLPHAFLTASSTESAGTTTLLAYNFSFITPLKNTTWYQGCTYSVDWVASTTIKELKLSLVDAGTRSVVDASLSNIPEELNGEILKKFDWKVGNRVWPGEYFLKISLLNGLDTEEKSYRFTIEAQDELLTKTEQKNLCTQSGGF